MAPGPKKGFTAAPRHPGEALPALVGPVNRPDVPGLRLGCDAAPRQEALGGRSDRPLAAVELVHDGDGDALDEALLESGELLLEVERQRRGEGAEELAQVIGGGAAAVRRHAQVLVVDGRGP